MHYDYPLDGVVHALPAGSPSRSTPKFSLSEQKMFASIKLIEADTKQHTLSLMIFDAYHSCIMCIIKNAFYLPTKSSNYDRRTFFNYRRRSARFDIDIDVWAKNMLPARDRRRHLRHRRATSRFFYPVQLIICLQYLMCFCHAVSPTTHTIKPLFTALVRYQPLELFIRFKARLL